MMKKFALLVCAVLTSAAMLSFTGCEKKAPAPANTPASTPAPADGAAPATTPAPAPDHGK